MIIVLLLLIFACQAQAQVDIEHYRGKEGMTGAARYSFNTNVGNVDVIDSGGAGNITFNRKNSVFLGVFKGGIGFQDGKRFANNGVLHLRYTRTSHPVYQPEFFIQGDYARSRKLDWRTLVGGGLRFNVQREKKWTFSLGNALMWERESLDVSPGDPHADFTSVVRSSNYINLIFQDRITLSTTAYYQFSLGDPGDIRVLGTIELTTPVVGSLDQTTSLDFRTDSDPPIGVKKTDAKLATSFGFKF